METAATEAPASEDVQQAPEAPTETPTSGEESSTTPEGGSEEVKSAPKTENRYQKLANENRQLRQFKQEAEQLRQQQAQFRGAAELDQWLRNNPKYIGQIMEWMTPQQQAQQQEDPYKEFAPEVAEKFRALDRLQAWQQQKEQELQQWNQMSQSQKQQAEIQHRQSLDQKFDEVLTKDGFLKDGVPTSEKLVSLISRATLAAVYELAQDPMHPTEGELMKAYSDVTAGLSEAEKRGLKTAVKQPGIPATGSKSGLMPGKGPETKEQRMARMLSDLGG